MSKTRVPVTLNMLIGDFWLIVHLYKVHTVSIFSSTVPARMLRGRIFHEMQEIHFKGDSSVHTILAQKDVVT